MKKTIAASSTALAVTGAKVVSSPIAIKKSDKKVALYLPPAMFGGITALVTGAGLLSGAPLEFAIPAIQLIGSLMAGGSVLVTAMTFGVLKSQAVEEAFQNTRQFHSFSSSLRKSPNKRILVNTFHIRKQDELEVNSYVDASEKVVKSRSTHTVHQYLAKTKKGYRVDQEIIPNAEMIWDVSADALVEVYGVQEKTGSFKEIGI